MARAKKTAFMQWIDGQLTADAGLARQVDELLNEMKLEQELVALRKRRGLTQRAFAKLLGTSQPYVAKLESGQIKNLGVRTLVKCATALGGSLTLRIETDPRPVRRAATVRSSRRAPGRGLTRAR